MPAAAAVRTEPWGYIAVNDAYWHSASLASVPVATLDAFRREAAEDGFEIRTVYTYAEYQRAIRSRLHWSKSPEYIAKYGDVP